MNTPCPQCHQGELLFQNRIELSNDARYDDNALSFYSCNVCFVRIIEIYRESRRGNLDCESSDQSYHLVSPAYFSEIQGTKHKKLGKLDKNDCWIFPQTIDSYGTLSSVTNPQIQELFFPQIPWMDLPLEFVGTGSELSVDLLGKKFRVEMGDFPAEDLYGVFDGEDKIFSFNDWPDNFKKIKSDKKTLPA